MNKFIKKLLAYSEGHLNSKNRRKFEKELQNNEELRDDYYLIKKINESMKARLDLEEVRNDPALNNLVPAVESLITNYYQNPENYKEHQKFVDESLNTGESDPELIEEINQIEKEIKEYKVNELAERWVNEWNEKKENLLAKNPNTERNKDFISRSLEPENTQPDLTISRKGKVYKRKYVFLINGLVAAALITGFIIFKVLIPVDNLDKLYDSYYEPMGVFSPVIRNINTNSLGKYTEAIEMYKKGNYQIAAAGFFDLIKQDSSFVSPYFFEGITQMELGHYPQAVTFLSMVIRRSGEYKKEAQWYMGLSYLKTGDRVKAMECFEVLAGSEGFYQDQAKILLRRLK